MNINLLIYLENPAVLYLDFLPIFFSCRCIKILGQVLKKMFVVSLPWMLKEWNVDSAVKVES